MGRTTGWDGTVRAGSFAKRYLANLAGRHGGYAVSQRIRKRIEEAFGWIKTVAGQEKTKLRDRVGWAFTFAAAAYNLVRLPKLLAASK